MERKEVLADDGCEPRQRTVLRSGFQERQRSREEVPHPEPHQRSRYPTPSRDPVRLDGRLPRQEEEVERVRVEVREREGDRPPAHGPRHTDPEVATVSVPER